MSEEMKKDMELETSEVKEETAEPVEWRIMRRSWRPLIRL